MAVEKDLSKGVIFPIGEKLPPQFSKFFIGNAHLKMLVSDGKCPIGNVTFEPGCRNNWHKHPGGQILLVTGGKGWYQEEGKPAQTLEPGDVVVIPEDVKHWHGAAAESWFSHLAVEGNASAGPAEWLEPVDDEWYSNL